MESWSRGRRGRDLRQGRDRGYSFERTAGSLVSGVGGLAMSLLLAPLVVLDAVIEPPPRRARGVRRRPGDPPPSSRRIERAPPPQAGGPPSSRGEAWAGPGGEGPSSQRALASPEELAELQQRKSLFEEASSRITPVWAANEGPASQRRAGG